MKRSVFIISALALAVVLTGCGRKQQTLEEMQEPMSMDELNKLSTEGQMSPESKAQAVQTTEPAAMATSQQPAAEQALAVSTVSKPTNQEIQTALKNLNLYAGAIDGKMGPATKKAIEEFQKMNNLKVDGKVGPKTWALLSKHLVVMSAEVTPKKKR